MILKWSNGRPKGFVVNKYLDCLIVLPMFKVFLTFWRNLFILNEIILTYCLENIFLVGKKFWMKEFWFYWKNFTWEEKKMFLYMRNLIFCILFGVKFNFSGCEIPDIWKLWTTVSLFSISRGIFLSENSNSSTKKHILILTVISWIATVLKKRCMNIFFLNFLL